MLIDDYSQGYQFGEYHERKIHATEEALYAAVQSVRAKDIFSFRTLMKLRGALNPSKRDFTDKPILEEARDVGFYPLATKPQNEIVLGAIGQFWRLSQTRSVKITDTQHFVNFSQPGYAKATLNFHIQPMGADICTLSTSTRIYLTSASAKKPFSVYWYAVRLGSGFIRTQWLKAIEQTL